MGIITTQQAAELVADDASTAAKARRSIQKACANGSVPGAVRPGREWHLDEKKFLEWWARRPAPGRRWPAAHVRKWPKRNNRQP